MLVRALVLRVRYRRGVGGGGECGDLGVGDSVGVGVGVGVGDVGACVCDNVCSGLRCCLRQYST